MLFTAFHTIETPYDHSNMHMPLEVETRIWTSGFENHAVSSVRGAAISSYSRWCFHQRHGRTRARNSAEIRGRPANQTDSLSHPLLPSLRVVKKKPDWSNAEGNEEQPPRWYRKHWAYPPRTAHLRPAPPRRGSADQPPNGTEWSPCYSGHVVD